MPLLATANLSQATNPATTKGPGPHANSEPRNTAGQPGVERTQDPARNPHRPRTTPIINKRPGVAR